MAVAVPGIDLIQFCSWCSFLLRCIETLDARKQVVDMKSTPAAGLLFPSTRRPNESRARPHPSMQFSPFREHRRGGRRIPLQRGSFLRKLQFELSSTLTMPDVESRAPNTIE